MQNNTSPTESVKKLDSYQTSSVSWVCFAICHISDRHCYYIHHCYFCF